MKKLRLLPVLFAAILIALSGCSKDEDFDIVNTWNHDSTKGATYWRQNYWAVTLEAEGSVTFSSDGSGSSTAEDFLEGDFTWVLSEDQLTITRGNNDRHYTLLTMKYNKMVAERDLRDEDGNGDVFEYNFSR